MSKSSFLSGVLFAAALTFVAGCGGDDDDFAAMCKKGCEASASLKCSGAATCAADCEKEINDLVAMKPGCKGSFSALGNCAAARPASDWECGAGGSPELKDGVCEKEGEAAIMCVLGGS